MLEIPEKSISYFLDYCNPTHKIHLDILVPFSGEGKIAKELKLRFPDAEITCIDINKNQFTTIQDDFFKWKTSKKYDYIVIDPSFENGLYKLAIQKAFSLLRINGIILSTAPNSFLTKIQDFDFRNFIAQFGFAEESKEIFKNRTCSYIKLQKISDIELKKSWKEFFGYPSIYHYYLMTELCNDKNWNDLSCEEFDLNKTCKFIDSFVELKARYYNFLYLNDSIKEYAANTLKNSY
jgi:hypothetical protein